MRRALTASATVLALVFALLGWMPGAYAQGSSAAPSQIGYLAISPACPTVVTPCFIQQISGGKSAALSVSTATTTQLVPLVAGASIYVTSYDVIAGGTGNITFEYGTGTNCGTGTTVLTGAYNLTAQAGIAKGNGAAPVLIIPPGNALCVVTSQAVQMSGSISYVQF